ncbi:MAG: valine--tRNA ligase [Trueperaceae bacterium]|nr:valine--tRNA ligase [Trueperaceae bacterium]
MAKELAKQYNPLEVEAKWVEKWANEPFTADALSDKPPFCIVIPPPNVTGNLHLGHAFDNAIIDTLIRFKRMQGFEALFQPGTDHAGISTQVQVERALREEGKSKYDLGREQFLERMWAWKEKYGGIILGQLQRLGISADWSRTRFTMDEGLSKAVRKQFVELYHKGLVYRGERIVNWDPVSQTTLSELEVDREERQGKLYTLAYELEDGSGAIQIATVRPETIFADQAIAVHPNDERYKNWLGKKVRIPLTDRFIPIITDEAVEMDFGTGALKITPAHDPTDFEIGERHNLARPSVIDLDAKLTGNLVPERFRGLERFEARKVVVNALEEEGSLIEAKDYTVSLGLSQRTKEPVEPIVSLQWFYNTDEVATRILKALDDKEISIFPERYTKVNRDWLEKLRHWNISRQLWWGHQIPAWYDDAGTIYVPDPENPELDCDKDPRYAHLNLKQDPDVFDTWFSSNLWPFSTLGWPDLDDPFFKKFYPTSVLVTGYDILFFWVARMEIAGYEFTDQRPFDHVLLHGLVLDEQGQKMSKSKGNGIDPLEVMDEFGADALRFATTYASTGGQDIRWDGRRVEMGRNFNNKLWNATRFAFMHLESEKGSLGLDEGKPETLAERWIMSRLQRAIKAVTTQLEAYDLGLANRAAYDFVWSEFCDWYLEAAKPALYEGNARSRYILRTVLIDILKLLHPMIPFVTSEIYEALGFEEQLGMANWPLADESLIDPDAEASFEHLKNAVVGARNLRAEANISPQQSINLYIQGAGAKTLEENARVFESLAKATLLSEAPGGAALNQVVPDLELKLPFEGLIDVNDWKARQEKRLADLRKNLAMSEKKLSNSKFVDNAPAAVVEEERRRMAESQALISGIEQSLKQLH